MKMRQNLNKSCTCMLVKGAQTVTARSTATARFSKVKKRRLCRLLRLFSIISSYHYH